MNNNYLKTIYNKNRTPYTNYPKKLISYIIEKFHLKKNMTLLEMGCGRGEHLKLFQEFGLKTYGIDLCTESQKINPDLNIKIVNIEKDKLPYEDNSFDIIYSKSFLEHLYYPEECLKEAYRTLKPDGILISLVPDWESQYKTFYDDYTHRTPFTVTSLSDIYSIHNFTKITVKKFRQLPIVWKFSFLNFPLNILAPLIPVRTKIGFLRWSRELMLIASGKKPK